MHGLINEPERHVGQDWRLAPARMETVSSKLEWGTDKRPRTCAEPGKRLYKARLPRPQDRIEHEFGPSGHSPHSVLGGKVD